MRRRALLRCAARTPLLYPHLVSPRNCLPRQNHAACFNNYVVIADIKCDFQTAPLADVQRALTSCIDGTGVNSTGGIGSAQPVTQTLYLSQPNRP